MATTAITATTGATGATGATATTGATVAAVNAGKLRDRRNPVTRGDLFGRRFFSRWPLASYVNCHHHSGRIN
jgi:hypothetical protein